MSFNGDGFAIDTSFFLEVSRVIQDRTREMLKEGVRKNDPFLVRGAITLTDITNADVDAEVEKTWWSLLSDPILDSLIRDELADITLEPVPPGGRAFGKLSWGRTALRKVGSAHPGEEPTLGTTKCVPVDMHSYMKINEDALRGMIYRFNRSAFLRNPSAYEIAQNALFIRTWVFAALASLVNLAWNGVDGGGTPGLDIFDGWLKTISSSASAHKDTTAGMDLLDTIFPSMYQNSGLDARHLDTKDICIYVSRQLAHRYQAQVLANSLDSRGTYNPRTGEMHFLNAKICPVTDMPSTPDGSNVLAVLTRKPNLVIGIVDKPMTIDHDFVLSTRQHEFSSPVQAKSIVVDESVVVYWQPPAA
jgi:hypothetical protein